MLVTKDRSLFPSY